MRRDEPSSPRDPAAPRDPRGVLADLAPAVAQLSSVAWAGARSSARGSMLQRDGSVGRVTTTDDGKLQAAVVDGEHPQRARLWKDEGGVQASCTCGEPKCPHAVALLLEVQKRARAAQQAVQQQSQVLAQLRERLGGPKPEADKPRFLSAMERLPVEAAVDMVALAWRQALRYGPGEVADLNALIDRLEAQAIEQPALTGELALRLVLALSAKKVVFTPLPEAAERAVVRLVPAIVPSAGPPPPAEALGPLVDLALDGHPQVAAHVAAGLELAMFRDPGLCQAVTERVQAWRQASSVQWREVSSPSGRDRLLSGLAGAWLAHDHPAEALEIAHLWPPMRTVLQDLGTALGRRGRFEDVVRLCGWYDPRGDLWTAGVLAACDAAAEAGHGLVAARLAAWAFDQQPGEAWFERLSRWARGPSWPQQRAALVERLLSLDDPPWLAEKLAAEPDAADALLHALVQGPLRDRTARNALQRLRELDPALAFHGRCARLLALVTVPGVTARQLRDELRDLQDLAQDLGEPGLAVDLARLLAREAAEQPAVAQALSTFR